MKLEESKFKRKSPLLFATYWGFVELNTTGNDWETMFLKIILILCLTLVIAGEVLFCVLAQASLGQPSQMLHKMCRAFLASCAAEPFAADWVLCKQRLLPAALFTQTNFISSSSPVNEEELQE